MSNKVRAYAGGRVRALGVWTVIFLAVLALSQPFLFGGCSGCQKEEPAAPVVKQLPPAPPGKVAETIPAGPPLGAVVPVTLGVLKLAPESSMVTLAVPPIPGIFDKAVALAKRLAPGDVNIDEEAAKAIAQMAQGAGVPDAKSLADIARGKGLNPDVPIALYVDLTPTAASAKSAFQAMQAEQDAQKAAPPAPEAAAKAEAAPPPPKPPAPKAPDMDKVFASLKVPAITGVIGCADPAKAEATIGEILGLAGGYVDPAKVETIDVGGVAVKCYDPEKLAYAIAGDKLVAGNSLKMLKEVLGRISAPAMVRYGTIECPASSTDEVVMLTRMDKVAPLIRDLLPDVLAASQPTGVPTPPGQLDYINKLLDGVTGDDPSVVTIEWTDKKLEVLGRCDFAKHPGLKEMSGEAKPLRLAAMLPEGTLTMLSMRLNDKSKEQFKNGWMNSLPSELKNEAGVSQTLTYLNTAMDLLGDEITIGIAGATGGLPQFCVMAGLGNIEQAKTMLKLLAPMTPSEPHSGVDISLLAVPVPLPIYIAFVENDMILCNDLERLKGLIDLDKAKSASKLFASLDPAIDAATPCYAALLIKSGLITDVVRPLSGFVGGIPPEIQGRIDKVVGTVRELRATKGMKNSWLEDRISVYFN